MRHSLIEDMYLFDFGLYDYLNFIKSDSMKLGYPFVVMAYIFTSDFRVILFERSDGLRACPITGCVEIGESYTSALIREIYEETGIKAQEDWMIRADDDYSAVTPTSKRNITIVSFGVYLPDGFDAQKEIRLNHEIASYRLVDIKKAVGHISWNGLKESREVYKQITGY